METETSETKFFTPSIVSFILGGFGFLLESVIITLKFSGHTGGENPCLIGVLFGIISIPIGGVSLGEIYRYPKRYKGKTMAALGLVFGLMCILIPITFLFLAFIAYCTR